MARPFPPAEPGPIGSVPMTHPDPDLVQIGMNPPVPPLAFPVIVSPASSMAQADVPLPGSVTNPVLWLQNRASCGLFALGK